MAPKFDDTKLLEVIESFIADHGYSPSVRELTTIMDVGSPATVWDAMKRLRLTGRIEWTANTARTIRVL